MWHAPIIPTKSAPKLKLFSCYTPLWTRTYNNLNNKHSFQPIVLLWIQPETRALKIHGYIPGDGWRVRWWFKSRKKHLERVWILRCCVTRPHLCPGPCFTINCCVSRRHSYFLINTRLADQSIRLDEFMVANMVFKTIGNFTFSDELLRTIFIKRLKENRFNYALMSMNIQSE